MLRISEFFKRIGGIQAREIAFRAGVQAAIKESTGVEIPIQSISFRSGKISLKNISQAARSAVFIKRSAIIERTNALQSVRHVDDFI